MPECLETALPEDGVVIQGIAPHMHEIGLKDRLFIVRDGQELPALQDQKHFDPNWQGFFMAHPEAIAQGHNHLRRNDRLYFGCSWDSSERDRDTHWGEGFEEEMCMNFVLIYPRFEDGMTRCTMWPAGHVSTQDYRTVENPAEFAYCFSPDDDTGQEVPTHPNYTWAPPEEPPNNCDPIITTTTTTTTTKDDAEFEPVISIL